MTENPEHKLSPHEPCQQPELRLAATDRDGRFHEATIAGCCSNTAVRHAAEHHWKPMRVSLARSWLCRPGRYELPWSADERPPSVVEREGPGRDTATAPVPSSATTSAPAPLATATAPQGRPSHEAGDRTTTASPVVFAGALSSGEWLELAGTLQDAIEDDLPLPEALRLLADDAPTRRTRRALRELAEELDHGVPLQQALARLPSRISRELAILVEAAQAAGTPPRDTAGGTPDEETSRSAPRGDGAHPDAASELNRAGALSRLIGDYVRQNQLLRSVTREIWLSLPYPLIAILAAVLLFLFLAWMVLPAFVDMFQDFGVELPLLTMLVLTAGDLVREHALVLLAGLAGAVAVSLLAARLILGNAFVVYCRDQIPLLGSIPRNLAYARLANTLAGLLAAEVPLPTALRTAAQLVRNAALRQSCTQLARQVEQGVPLREALGHVHPPLHRDVATALAWNDDREGLVDALRTAAALFAAEARIQVAMLVVFLEPAVIATVAGAIAFIVVSLLLPLIKLLNDLA